MQTATSVKKKVGSALGGAIATAGIPASFGVMDWRLLAGMAALGAIGGFCGVNVAARIRRVLPQKKTPNL